MRPGMRHVPLAAWGGSLTGGRQGEASQISGWRTWLWFGGPRRAGASLISGYQPPASVLVSRIALPAAAGSATNTIDVNAAGHGWFVDPAPDRISLLADLQGARGHVIRRELTHESRDVMHETFDTGTRLLPASPAVTGEAELDDAVDSHEFNPKELDRAFTALGDLQELLAF